MLTEKLDDLEQFASTIDKLISWNDIFCCHLFYIMDDYNSSDRKLEAKKGFTYFITQTCENKLINVFSIHDLSLMNDSDKEKYYSKNYINLIDCSDLDKNNLHVFNNLYDSTRATNANFIYYTNQEIFKDFIFSTEQFKLRSYSTFSCLDQDMIAFKAYHTLNEKIINKIDHIPVKKKKI